MGEISPDEFVHFIGEDIRLDPVMLDKDMSIEELLSFYMGKNTPTRQEFIIDNDDLDHRTIDSLVKLSKEIRESLKYALEFKGQLVHKREETVVIQQIEIIQKVLIERYPQVWNEIRDSVAERLA